MVELRCSLDLALAIGAEVPGTRKHLQQLRGDGNMIVIHYADFAPPLFGRWQLGRDERAEARR